MTIWLLLPVGLTILAIVAFALGVSGKPIHKEDWYVLFGVLYIIWSCTGAGMMASAI